MAKISIFAKLFRPVIQTKYIELLTHVTLDLFWSTAYRVWIPYFTIGLQTTLRNSKYIWPVITLLNICK